MNLVENRRFCLGGYYMKGRLGTRKSYHFHLLSLFFVMNLQHLSMWFNDDEQELREDDGDCAEDHLRGRDDRAVPGRAAHRGGARDARAVQGQRRGGQVLRSGASPSQTGHCEDRYCMICEQSCKVLCQLHEWLISLQLQLSLLCGLCGIEWPE